MMDIVQQVTPDDLEELESSFTVASVEQVRHPLPMQYGIDLWIKREDLLHPVISGNKWRKLKFNLRHAVDLGYDHIVSMGGPWSNHLHALAWVGQQLDMKTTGIIRGEESATQTPTLKDIRRWGMRLQFVNRVRFRELRREKKFNACVGIQNAYWLPEGGANQYSLKGIEELITEITDDFDTITLACGSGTTLAGIASCLPAKKHALGFSALKGANFLDQEVNNLLTSVACEQKSNWSINHDYHFGGFAKTNHNLLRFIHDFENQTGIPLEPVYTGKMMYGLFDLISKGLFKPEQKIIALHTGGLQGNRHL